MTNLRIINADVIEGLGQIGDESVHAIVTDPPYELGFMGKAWDSTGIAYNVDVWRGCLRVLKPGGHLLAFGGSRTYHRLACAVEDSGFEIRYTTHPKNNTYDGFNHQPPAAAFAASDLRAPKIPLLPAGT